MPWLRRIIRSLSPLDWPGTDRRPVQSRTTRPVQSWTTRPAQPWTTRPVQRWTTSQWADFRQSTLASVSLHGRSILIYLLSLLHNISNYEYPLKTTLLSLSRSLKITVSLEIKFQIKQNSKHTKHSNSSFRKSICGVRKA